MTILTEGKQHHCGVRSESQISNENWKKEITESNRATPNPENPIECDLFMQEAKSYAQRHISPNVRELLYQLANPESKVDAILIERLPFEHPGDIPKDGKKPVSLNKIPEMVNFGLIGVAGLTPFGYKQEKEGRLVHDVIPLNGREKEQSNAGRDKFGWHMDDPCFYPYHPEFLLLIGLINREIATLILTLKQILLQTSKSLIEKLRQPIFTFGSPQSFDFNNGMCISGSRPIIYTDEFGIDRIALPGRNSIQLDAQAKELLLEFHNHLDGLTPSKVVISPGRILAFRNDRCLHGRESIPNDTERWLQRIYATSDIAKYRKITGSNDLQFVFDARLLFGN